jgi:tripartite-type tricarboxylate transporter receptor subunit TctC
MRLFTALLVGLLATAGAHAQTYPTRPIRLVIGYSPGGSGDFITRLVAAEMGKELGTSVFVENVAGAGGNIANAQVAKAPADGYTLLVSSHPAVNKVLYKSIAYDADKDFAPVSRLATGATVICVKNDLPVKNLKELLAYAKANPGKLFNASAGFGSAPHLASALFESAAGVQFSSLQFKGGAPAAMSVMAGDSDLLFAVPPTVISFIKAGKLRPLALTQPNASPAVPGIPGAREAGLKDYEYTFWFGMFAPAATPKPVLKRLNEAVSKVLAQHEVQEKIASQGMEATPSKSAEAFEAQVKAEGPVLVRQMTDAGIRAE